MEAWKEANALKDTFEVEWGKKRVETLVLQRHVISLLIQEV